MAASVTPNLTLVSNADTTTGWSGNSGGQDLEVKIQGSASYTWQAAKNARTACTFTPATNLDMSGTDAHLYWWAKNDVAPFMEPKRTGTTSPSGYNIRLQDSAGNYKEWHIAGNDTWGGEWRCFVLDLANTSQVYASSGTLDLSDIDVITWYVDISNSGNIRIIDNQWNDVVRFGTGLTVTGTDFDLVDIAAIDENSSNRYGILENIDGVIFSQGSVIIGSGATTTTFNSTDETLIFRDRIGQGRGIVSSTLYQLKFTGSGCDVDIVGLVCKGAGATDTTRPVIDGSDTNLNSLVIDGSTFIHCDTVDFYSGADVQNSVFSNCLQIDPSTGTFKFNTISNYTGSAGALLFPSDGSNLSNCSFINNSNAVEYGTGSDSSDPTFNALTFDDVSGKYDVNNTSGSSVSIAKTNGANPNSYNPGGSAVTFTASFTHTLTGVQEESEVTYVRVSDGAELFHVESVSATGQTQYTHSGGESVDILIMHLDYIAQAIPVTLGNADETLPIQQQVDRIYANP